MTDEELERMFAREAVPHEAPYLLHDLVSTGRVQTPQLRRVILGVWSGAEFPCLQVQPEVWLDWFRRVGFVATDERDAPVEPIEVWRAQAGSTVGLSWTTSPDTARFFHERNEGWGLSSRILHGFAPPEDVLGVPATRPGEHEVIVDPRSEFWRAAKSGKKKRAKRRGPKPKPNPKPLRMRANAVRCLQLAAVEVLKHANTAGQSSAQLESVGFALRELSHALGGTYDGIRLTRPGGHVRTALLRLNPILSLRRLRETPTAAPDLRGDTVIICGAGPSLASVLDQLPEAAAHAHIIATNSAARAVSSVVCPDLLMSTEHLDVSGSIEGATARTAVCSRYAPPAVWSALATAADRVCVLPNPNAAAASVTTSAVRLAGLAGAGRIVLVGVDCASRGGDRYVSGSPASDEAYHLEAIRRSVALARRHGAPCLSPASYSLHEGDGLMIEGSDGGLVPSSTAWVQQRDQLVHLATRRERPIALINASTGGARIRGWEEMPLAAALDGATRANGTLASAGPAMDVEAEIAGPAREQARRAIATGTAWLRVLEGGPTIDGWQDAFAQRLISCPIVDALNPVDPVSLWDGDGSGYYRGWIETADRVLLLLDEAGF